MPLVPYVDPETADDRTRELLDADADRYGRPSLFARAMANNPDVLAARQAYVAALADASTLDRRLLELTSVAVSAANDCDYCVASHVEQLVEHVGLPDAEVRSLVVGDRSGLAARERTVVETATRIATDPRRIRGEDFDRLRDLGFDDADLVAFVTLVGAAVSANTFADAVDVLPGDRQEGFEGYGPDEREG